MSFLDDIAPAVFDALALDFRPATLEVETGRAPDGRGGFEPAFTAQPCRAIVDDYSLARRAMVGIPADDRAITVLGHGLTTPPAPGGRITIEGRPWLIVSVSRDPAAATYELQVR